MENTFAAICRACQAAWQYEMNVLGFGSEELLAQQPKHSCFIVWSRSWRLRAATYRLVVVADIIVTICRDIYGYQADTHTVILSAIVIGKCNGSHFGLVKLKSDMHSHLCIFRHTGACSP